MVSRSGQRHHCEQRMVVAERFTTSLRGSQWCRPAIADIIAGGKWCLALAGETCFGAEMVSRSSGAAEWGASTKVGNQRREHLCVLSRCSQSGQTRGGGAGGQRENSPPHVGGYTSAPVFLETAPRFGNNRFSLRAGVICTTHAFQKCAARKGARNRTLAENKRRGGLNPPRLVRAAVWPAVSPLAARGRSAAD